VHRAGQHFEAPGVSEQADHPVDIYEQKWLM
jgi:hypothetical protein